MDRGSSGALSGTLQSDQGSFPFTSVVAKDRTMTLTAVLSNVAEVVFVLDFVGGDFTGKWAAAGITGSVSGARKKT